MTQTRSSRRYDSTLRRERAAQTRDRIVAAGAELVHGFSSWDWRTLTVRSVAERAGVHERTVYRHFATEQDLRAAVVSRLEEEAGLHPEDLTLAGIGPHVSQLFDYLASFSSSAERVPDESLAAVDARRKAAILGAVASAAPSWSEDDRTLAAALIDVLWGVPTYRRLVSGWQLDSREASRGVTWVIELLLAAVREDRPPAVS